MTPWDAKLAAEVATLHRRDLQAQRQIAAARAPATDIEPWTCAACGEPQDPRGPVGDRYGRCQKCSKEQRPSAAPAAGIELAMQEVDVQVERADREAANPPMAFRTAADEVTLPVEPPPHTILTGDHHEAYVEFTAASRALVEHQTAGQALTERYRMALTKLSQLVAAKP